jgi:hypothetical protein
VITNASITTAVPSRPLLHDEPVIESLACLWPFRRSRMFSRLGVGLLRQSRSGAAALAGKSTPRLITWIFQLWSGSPLIRCYWCSPFVDYETARNERYQTADDHCREEGTGGEAHGLRGSPWWGLPHLPRAPAAIQGDSPHISSTHRMDKRSSPRHAHGTGWQPHAYYLEAAWRDTFIRQGRGRWRVCVCAFGD